MNTSAHKELTGATGSSGGYDLPLRALLFAPLSLGASFSESVFAATGCQLFRAYSLEEAMTLCNRLNPQLVVAPLRHQGEHALPYLERCRELRENRAIVVVAQNDQIKEAAAAMRAGADDCLFLPFSEARLERTLRAALRARGVLSERTAITAVPPPPTAPAIDEDGPERTIGPAHVETLIGTSPQMQDVIRRVAAIASTVAPVLIRGEVGTGKSTVAHVLHDLSDRRNAPLITVDCANLTDAQFSRIFEETPLPANGTLFLDRVDELDHRFQTRLLARLALNETITPDSRRCRIISALRVSPGETRAPARLREDLYYSLNVVELDLPPLRQREGDVAFIVEKRITEFAKEENRMTPRIDRDVMARLTDHDWPGNLHELLGVLRQISLVHSEGRVRFADLPSGLSSTTAIPLGPRDDTRGYLSQRSMTAGVTSLIGLPLAEIERAVIEATIAAEGGSIPRAARILDVSPSTIYRKREAWEKSED